ncbi:MAG: FAD-binding oxidoreductase [Gemmatimonadales bacterium]|nr:MAG: FAD-binding oxidoreductase [Gemmatimonadales bacterium]
MVLALRTPMRWKRMEVTGWGRTRRVEVLACRPHRLSEIPSTLAALNGDGTSLIAHGAGRSYGDVATNEQGRVLLTERLNRILAFDEANLEVVCEPGVTFQDLLDVFGPRGILFPLSPGTAFTTMGGAVACDVHGKNQEHVGSFGDHVRWIDLALPTGRVVRTSRLEDPELFAATIGGLGLTGIILRVSIGLVRVPSLWSTVHERRMPHLDAFMDAFEACRRTASHSVGWIDGQARGESLGRGILETAEFADGPRSIPSPRRARSIPFDLPPGILNRLSIRAFNGLYYRRIRRRGRIREVPLAEHLYPLDSIHDWNRLYGRRGFHQFQCVIPDGAAREGIRTILGEVGAAPVTPFLGVLKSMGSEGIGHLSFPRKGFSLALDFPDRDETTALLSRLERITRDHGGRIYLAKDSILSPEAFREMYPRHGDFREVLQRVDPEGRLSSDLVRRIGLRP